MAQLHQSSAQFEALISIVAHANRDHLTAIAALLEAGFDAMGRELAACNEAGQFEAVKDLAVAQEHLRAALLILQP